MLRDKMIILKRIIDKIYTYTHFFKKIYLTDRHKSLSCVQQKKKKEVALLPQKKKKPPFLSGIKLGIYEHVHLLINNICIIYINPFPIKRELNRTAYSRMTSYLRKKFSLKQSDFKVLQLSLLSLVYTHENIMQYIYIYIWAYIAIIFYCNSITIYW